MPVFDRVLVNQKDCPAHPMSVDCKTTSGMIALGAVKKALNIPFDFSKFEIVCNVNDAVKFRIEGPILKDDLERVLKAINESHPNA